MIIFAAEFIEEQYTKDHL